MNIAEIVKGSEQMLRRQEFSESNAQRMETMQGTCLTKTLSIFSSKFLDFDAFNVIFADSRCCTYFFDFISGPITPIKIIPER